MNEDGAKLLFSAISQLRSLTFLQLEVYDSYYDEGAKLLSSALRKLKKLKFLQLKLNRFFLPD